MASASHIYSTQLVFQELIDTIILPLSRDISSLLSLCQVSRHGAYTAQKHLYSRISLNFDSAVLGKFQLGRDRAAQWLATVTSNPSLAHRLVCFAINEVDEMFWPLLLPAFRTMDSLTDLTILIPPTSYLQGLWGCPFRLEHFSLVTKGLIQEEGLIKFLVEQTEIVVILLMGDWTVSQETRLSIPSAACPNLKLFQSERKGIEIFLRDRPNVPLTLWMDFRLQEGSALPPSLDFGHTLARLTLLILNSPPDRESLHRPPLSHISQYLTALRVLSIVGEYYNDELYEISKLPRLVGFYLNSDCDHRRLPEPVEAGLASLWFHHSCSLRAAHFCVGTFMEDDLTPTFKFRVWKRAMVDPSYLQFNVESGPYMIFDETDIYTDIIAELAGEEVPGMKA